MVISRSGTCHGTCHGGAESDSIRVFSAFTPPSCFSKVVSSVQARGKGLILCVSAGVLEIVMLSMISKHPSGPGATILPLYQLSNEPLAALTSRTQSSGGLCATVYPVHIYTIYKSVASFAPCGIPGLHPLRSKTNGYTPFSLATSRVRKLATVTIIFTLSEFM